MAKHGDVWKSKCGMMELRCGDYREVLQDVECDAVITDPPYSERTHSGHSGGVRSALPYKRKSRGGQIDPVCARREINYSAWDRGDIEALIATMNCGGWWVALSDSTLFPVWRECLSSAGLTTFQPVACVIPGMTVRLNGDGPSSWTVYANVARPKALCKWGTLPGAYRSGVGKPVLDVIGGKPLPLMRSLVRDYSRPGDLICDPCAGGGTTLLAAAQEGRRAIGAEIDPDTFELAVKRLSAGYTPDLFAGVQP